MVNAHHVTKTESYVDSLLLKTYKSLQLMNSLHPGSYSANNCQKTYKFKEKTNNCQAVIN
jgi:hypothetical protein